MEIMITSQYSFICCSSGRYLSNYKVNIRITICYRMFILKTAENTANSQVFRPRASFMRPLSQQRPSTFNHLSPNPPHIAQKSPIHRQQAEVVQHSEYYVQGRVVVRDKAKPPIHSAKVIQNSHLQGSESLESVRNSLLLALEKTAFKFNEEIARQNQQIKKLQKKIDYQNQEIETKNHIIKNLITKYQHTREATNKLSLVDARKIEDLEIKLQVLIDQIEEERLAVHNKLDTIAINTIAYMGSILNASKNTLLQFISNSSKRIEDISADVTAMASTNLKGVKALHNELAVLQNSIKYIQEAQQSKENCSQINSSKDTASFNSSMSSNKTKRDLFSSDYFFHPAEADSPCVKVIQQLAKQREKLKQLPIRVYVDGLGRLKYYQSRTFIFDRKGNFTAPSTGDITFLQQKGWVKLVAQ